MRAEQVSDNHTQIEGFGLTREGKAQSWFQTLEPSIITTLQILEKDFIIAFSKMGIKHNALAQIYAFRQKAHESVRDCANRLKQYVTRCPNKEKPSQRRLISMFLEGYKTEYCMLTCMQRNIHASMSVALMQWTMMITLTCPVSQVKKTSLGRGLS